MTSADIKLVQGIHRVLNNGFIDKNPRPRYADGTPAHTISINHVFRQYNLEHEFPICTLRPIAWKSAIREILWIYQDQSNSLDILHNKYHIHYWDQWESVDLPGTIGIRYGATVRKHHLMDKLLQGIREDPYGRRHIMSLWQTEDFQESDGLLPCAFLTNWNVRGDYLDMLLYQRSGDMLAASGAGGINEVQYAALQIMVAYATGYKPGIFTHVVCNEQIYDRHIEAALELQNRAIHREIDLENVKYAFNPQTNDFYNFKDRDFELIGYDPLKPQLFLDLGI